MPQLMKQLKHHEEFIGECTVVGALFTFRKMTLSALKSVVGARAPFLQVITLQCSDIDTIELLGSPFENPKHLAVLCLSS